MVTKEKLLKNVLARVPVFHSRRAFENSHLLLFAMTNYPPPPFSECHYRLISEMPAVIRIYDPD